MDAPGTRRPPPRPVAVVDGEVEHHPLNPDVRPLADVEILLRKFPATQAWIRQQLDLPERLGDRARHRTGP